MEKLIARSTHEVNIAFERLSAAREIGCDTETSSLSPRSGRLFSIQFSDGGFSCLLPISEGISPGPLAGILANPATLKIFHNARFDLEFLRENGLEVKNIFCTMIAEKLLTKGANQSASLAETLYRYFAIDLDKSHRAKFGRNWDGVWTEELTAYALADVAHLPRLKAEQEKWLEKLGMRDSFEGQIRRLNQSS